MNLKFHRNCVNAGKISCVRSHFGPLCEIRNYFSGSHKKFSLVLLHITDFIFAVKCSGTRFLSTEN